MRFFTRRWWYTWGEERMALFRFLTTIIFGLSIKMVFQLDIKQIRYSNYLEEKWKITKEHLSIWLHCLPFQTLLSNHECLQRRLDPHLHWLIRYKHLHTENVKTRCDILTSQYCIYCIYIYDVDEYINHATYRICGKFSIVTFTSIWRCWGSNIITIASRWCDNFSDFRRCLFIWAVNNGCSNVYDKKLDNKGEKRDVAERIIWCDNFTNLLTLRIFDGLFHVWC